MNTKNMEKEKLTRMDLENGGGVDAYNSIDNSVNGEPLKEPSLKYSGTQSRTLGVLCFCYFLSYTCYALHSPFFPKEAVVNGSTLTVAGFVFGVHQLTAFLMSLVCGSLMGRIQPKKIATLGIFIMAVSSVAFGFLKYLDHPVIFMTSAFILRMVQASGSAALVTSAFAIIAQQFSETVPKAISRMEASAGLGLIVGPAVGGALYEFGGFLAPFVMMGLIMFAAGVLALIYIPETTRMAPISETEFKSNKPPNRADLLKIWSVSVAMLAVFASSTGFGFMMPSLERFVSHHFNLPEAFTGILFVIDGAVYVLTTPIWGWLCQKYERPRGISLVGCCLMVIGFSCAGPIPLFTWRPHLLVTCLAYVTFSLGVAASFVASFVIGLGDLKAHGFPDTAGTYGLVSGLWSAHLSLGACTGASLGGFLVHHFGFQSATNYVVGVQIFVTILTAFSCFKYGSRVKLLGLN